MQSVKSLFFGKGCIIPFFQSSGTSSDFQTLLQIVRGITMISPPCFMYSSKILSIPAALLFFNFLMAVRISCTLILSKHYVKLGSWNRMKIMQYCWFRTGENSLKVMSPLFYLFFVCRKMSKESFHYHPLSVLPTFVRRQINPSQCDRVSWSRQPMLLLLLHSLCTLCPAILFYLLVLFPVIYH